jgi:hypothetical protein
MVYNGAASFAFFSFLSTDSIHSVDVTVAGADSTVYFAPPNEKLCVLSLAMKPRRPTSLQQPERTAVMQWRAEAPKA